MSDVTDVRSDITESHPSHFRRCAAAALRSDAVARALRAAFASSGDMPIAVATLLPLLARRGRAHTRTDYGTPGRRRARRPTATPRASAKQQPKKSRPIIAAGGHLGRKTRARLPAAAAAWRSTRGPGRCGCAGRQDQVGATGGAYRAHTAHRARERAREAVRT